jgi:WhiB family transcriptional regulator, redox-sensing transcriptional regulator
MKDGACRNVSDPDPLFFPKQGGSSKAARAVCSACGVRVQCLTYALDNHEVWGVWGGTSYPERRKLKRAMRNGGAVTARSEPPRHVPMTKRVLEATATQGADCGL